jgi:hypothetical protein
LAIDRLNIDVSPNWNNVRAPSEEESQQQRQHSCREAPYGFFVFILPVLHFMAGSIDSNDSPELSHSAARLSAILPTRERGGRMLTAPLSIIVSDGSPH